jgi:signal transduction histidine kinase
MPIALFDILKPHSARATLAAIGLMASTVLMVALSAGGYFLTEQRLNEQKGELWRQVQQHLGPPASTALWVYNLPGLNAVLRAELGGAVLGLAVVNDMGAVVAQQGQVLPVAGGTLPGDVQVLVMDIPVVGRKELGRIHVAWSDATLRQALRENLWLALAQLVAVNLVLLAVVWVGVDRLIFRRVGQLQQALDHAASRDMAADIVAIPVSQKDEFGAITRSINAITARLGEELEAGHESEEEARVALANLQNAQDGLVRAEKLASLGRLVAGVAHELNTPIGNIVMVASTQQELASQLGAAATGGALTRAGLNSYVERLTEGADLILTSAHRSAELIKNFKQVAVDQTTDQLRNFDLAQQISEVLSVLSHVLTKTPIHLVQDLQNGVPMHSYPGPLGQVLTNLVMNAIKHGFNDVQPGTITVSCAREGDRARITVADTGAGIAPENVSRIFDPFFTTKLGQGGTGLGLYIVHNIVYGPLGGSLGVDSTQGGGATFTLVLPLIAPSAGFQDKAILPL